MQYLLRDAFSFECGRCLISVPGNYYFFSESSEYFIFTPVDDKDIKITYEINNYENDWDITDEDIYEDIKQSIHNHQRDTYETEAPIEAFENNNLKGYCSTYSDDEEDVYEAGMLLGNSIALTVTIYDQTHSIEEIKNSTEFKALFNGIKKI